MDVRKKSDHTVTGFSGQFNISALDEIVVYFDIGDASSEYIGDYQVQLHDGTWKDLDQAFKDGDVVPNDTNTYFYEEVKGGENVNDDSVQVS
jgi:hypothetical protein